MDVEPDGTSPSSGGQSPPMNWIVYVLHCSDEDLYTGCTGELDDRIARHLAGQVPATARRRPFELVWYCCFPDKYTAYRFEKYLKSGSGRAFLWKHILERKKGA